MIIWKGEVMMLSSNPHTSMLVFAPHPDDEVLGAGGTIIKKAIAGDSVVVCIATLDNYSLKRKEESETANRFMGVKETVFLGFPDLGLDSVPHGVLTESIRRVIQEYMPAEVYVPHPGDLHTDHKTLTAAVLVAIRPKYTFAPPLAFTYETLSETGLDYQNPLNHFAPNIYVDISDTVEKKIEAMMIHESQLEQFPCSRSRKALEALSIYRGTQAGMKAAEAFSLIRGYIR